MKSLSIFLAGALVMGAIIFLYDRETNSEVQEAKTSPENPASNENERAEKEEPGVPSFFPKIVTYSGSPEEAETIPKGQTQQKIERKPSSSSSSMSKVIAANTASPSAVPIPLIESPENRPNPGDRPPSDDESKSQE